MRKYLAGLVAALLCALPFVTAPARAPRAPRPAMWMVKDKDTTIYLFGTIHVLKPGIPWFQGPIKAAFDQSKELVIEMIEPETAQAQNLVMQRAIDPDGPPLTQKLPAATADAYRKAMAKIGLPTAQYEAFEPWFISNVLVLVPVQQMGLDSKSGVETVLSAEAKKQGKHLGELETLSQQLDLFDAMPEADQISYLKSTIDDMDELGSTVDQMINAWKTGDEAGLAAVMNKGLNEQPALRKRLLADRNARWAQWIAKRMEQPGTVFVAVGAGHLVGTDSVQAMLKGHKIKAKRVKT